MHRLPLPLRRPALARLTALAPLLLALPLGAFAPAARADTAAPTPAAAAEFIDRAEQELFDLTVAAERAN